MNRTDRLYAMAEELRLVGDTGCSADFLSRRFEVSVRTVKRDVSALQQAGLPVASIAGRGGGYRLINTGAPSRPLTFTPGEAAAIAIALGTQPDLPYATDGAAALTKILRAMSHSQRSAAKELLGRVWTTRKPSRSRAARTIDLAIQLRVVVRITYLGSNGKTTHRRVDPIHFANTNGHWYLLAYCHSRKGGRWFRLDRISNAQLTREQAPNHDVREVIGTPPPEAHPVTLN